MGAGIAASPLSPDFGRCPDGRGGPVSAACSTRAGKGMRASRVTEIRASFRGNDAPASMPAPPSPGIGRSGSDDDHVAAGAVLPQVRQSCPASASARHPRRSGRGFQKAPAPAPSVQLGGVASTSLGALVLLQVRCSHDVRVAQSAKPPLTPVDSVDNGGNEWRPQLPGSHPCGASSNPANSNPGTTVQLTSAQPAEAWAACQRFAGTNPWGA